MAKVKRILLECTHTYKNNLNTGIQRVVRNIVKESKAVAEEIGIECQPVITQKGFFWHVEKMKTRPSLRAYLNRFLKDSYQKLRPLLRMVVPFRSLRRLLFTGWTSINLAKMVNFVLDLLSFPVLLIAYFQKKVFFKKGDLLIMLDSSWAHSVWPAVKKAKKQGVKIALVVHDIFQVTHNHLFIPGMTERFRIWLDESLENVDFFIAVSQTTRDEIRKYAESKQPTVQWDGRFDYFRLGCVMDNINKDGYVRDELKKIFENNKIYLTVGTIEPRKNHKYLLDAFDEVWRQKYNTGLCIAGKVGWFCDGLGERITKHPNYNKRLFMFENLTDTELDYCYRHAGALVYPSIVEGFGLPLVEALYKNLPVFASDIPIFREVGRDFCTYFDLSNPQSLAQILIKIEKTGRIPEVRPSQDYKLPNWNDSCRELFIKTISLYKKHELTSERK